MKLGERVDIPEEAPGGQCSSPPGASLISMLGEATPAMATLGCPQGRGAASGGRGDGGGFGGGGREADMNVYFHQR